MLQSKPKSLIPKGGNDRVYTPQPLADAIVIHFNVSYLVQGKILEPCKGKGAFMNAIRQHIGGYCSELAAVEIDEGTDFLKECYVPSDYKYNWVISNFPFSKYREFLKKSMLISDNIITLSPVNHVLGMKARRRDIKDAGFHVREICEINTPKEFPQSGFQWAATYLSRVSGPCQFTSLSY